MKRLGLDALKQLAYALALNPKIVDQGETESCHSMAQAKFAGTDRIQWRFMGFSSITCVR